MSDIFNGVNFNVPGPEDVPIARNIFGYAKKASEKIKEGIESFLPGIPALRESVRQRSLQPEIRFVQENVRKFVRAKTPEELAPFVLGFTGEAEPIKNVVGPTSEVLIQEADSALAKLMKAIKSSRPVREEITAMQSAERSIRIGRAAKILEEVPGEKGIFQAKAQLKGPLIAEKPRFEPLRASGIQNQEGKLTQSEIDSLVTQIQIHPTLTPFEKINTADGLGQLLGGEVPQSHKLSLLEDVFGKDLVKTVLSKRSGLDKLKDIGLNFLNLPRAVMASFDFSFGARQGAFAAPTFRKEFWQSWKKQFGAAFSEKSAVRGSELIARNPDYILAREGGVSFTKVGSILSDREEKYASNWGDRIPIIKQSSRTYTFFANKFRMDIFHSMANDARAIGIDLEKHPEVVREIAKFVNNATGRGELPSFLQRSAPILNAAFFSPKLMFSRLRLLYPETYIKADPFVRKQAIKSLIGFGGYVTTVLTLAHLAGAKVGLDPRNSDFLKIRSGNTRFDIAAGFQQYIRMFAQIVTGKYVSSTTGKVITLGEGYRPINRLDILGRQVESKEAPVFSFITDLLRQQDYAGQPVSFKKEIASRFIPLVLQDLYDIAKDNPKLLPWGLLGIFGFGVQTYGKPKRSIFQ